MLDTQARTISLLFVMSLAMALSVRVCGAQSPVANAPASQASGSSIREQLIGTWRLVSRESRRANGELEPDPKLSVVPLGLLIYDRSGHVAAQLSRRDRSIETVREECRTAADTKGTSDTAQTVLGYDAYFGTYKINERDGIVTHHLESAIWPEDVGKDIDRHFKLSGDKLTISFNTSTHDGVKVTRTLIWERQK